MILKNLNTLSIFIIVTFSVTVLLYILFKEYFRYFTNQFITSYPGIKKRMKATPVPLLVFRYILYFLFALLISLSVLNPGIEDAENPNQYVDSGVDILFLVDVSLSMNATDTTPSRLSKFKEEALKLVPKLEGNRVGIVAFAGAPFLYCPMTSDVSAFSEYIRGLDVDMIPDTSTDIQAAFQKTEDILKSKKVFRNKVVILVTDGENMNGSIPSRLSSDLIIWGVGTSKGGLIYYSDPIAGLSGYVTRNGMLVNNTSSPDLVISKLDEPYLKKLTDSQGAVYTNLSRNPNSSGLLLDKINSMQKNAGKHLLNLTKKDGYHFFMIPAFLLFILDIAVIELLLYRKLKL